MNRNARFFGCQGLVKRYTDVTRVVTVLDGLSLEVKQGEMVAIVGRSGSGKSTLLHLLGLLDSPDGGRITHQGEEISGLSDAERVRMRNRVFGFVFQSYHLLPEFNALENVIMPAMVCSAAEWRARRGEVTDYAHELLDRVDLSARADHRPSQLSGGEQQRVAIARALVNRPQILLCDEPTGNLDGETSDTIHALVRNVVRELGTTALVVTHDMEFAELADRVHRIEHGRLEPIR